MNEMVIAAEEASPGSMMAAFVISFLLCTLLIAGVSFLESRMMSRPAKERKNARIISISVSLVVIIIWVIVLYTGVFFGTL